MSRPLIIIYILLCFELGAFLVALPWTSIWSKNFFVTQYPWVSSIALNYFVRGAVSGIGLADVWLAIFELWRLRRQLGLVRPRSSR
ncbi:MAG: hypothetical protein LAN62_10620 [Acidobacteriia bacterium]|nr:hypothetical protein [Terriglobia bacterium]